MNHCGFVNLSAFFGEMFLFVCSYNTLYNSDNDVVLNGTSCC